MHVHICIRTCIQRGCALFTRSKSTPHTQTHIYICVDVSKYINTCIYTHIYAHAPTRKHTHRRKRIVHTESVTHTNAYHTCCMLNIETISVLNTNITTDYATTRSIQKDIHMHTCVLHTLSTLHAHAYIVHTRYTPFDCTRYELNVPLLYTSKTADGASTNFA